MAEVDRLAVQVGNIIHEATVGEKTVDPTTLGTAIATAIRRDYMIFTEESAPMCVIHQGLPVTSEEYERANNGEAPCIFVVRLTPLDGD